MKIFLISLAIVAAAFGGWWIGRHDHGDASAAQAATAPPPKPETNSTPKATDQKSAVPVAPRERKIAYYQSPMHPWVKSNKPGKCTICGMDLTPVYAPDVDASDADAVLDPSILRLSKQSIQVTGVETALVTQGTVRRTIRVGGRIDDDESRHRRLSATADGRVEKLFVNFVGAEVKAGQPLATLYSPALRTVFGEYHLITQQPASPQRERLLAGVRERLLRIGLSATEIDAAATQDKAPSEIQLLAPIAGTVISRNVYEGQYVKEGDLLFEVGDFSKMWFVFDAYERDLPWIRPGAEVEITTPALPGKVLRAPVSFIDPNLNMETRSAKIRVVLDNAPNEPGALHHRELLHKLYAEGRIFVESAPTLTVPRGAVLWVAGKPIVYVAQAEGVYQPREVQVGGAGDEVWEIAGGLAAGERVVTSGNLLLDAQAQINRPPEPTKPALTEAQRSAALDFFTGMAALSDALATDKPGEFQKARLALAAPTAALQKAFGQRVAGLVELAKLPDTTDLAEQRKAFYPLSETAADFALVLRREDEKLGVVRVFACDMAKGNVPTATRERGRWIQMRDGLRNPWWGAEMLECGAEIKP